MNITNIFVILNTLQHSGYYVYHQL